MLGDFTDKDIHVTNLRSETSLCSLTAQGNCHVCVCPITLARLLSGPLCEHFLTYIVGPDTPWIQDITVEQYEEKLSMNKSIF